ncbi:MAG: hypothetical protein H0W21_02090 [Actinobacteria bacterium]|nr:hypothetical protein [Actinomycetota bacterium]
MGLRICVWLVSMMDEERGDVPGWVLIMLMTSALVVAIWGVARGRLVAIVETALNTVCGSLGC